MTLAVDLQTEPLPPDQAAALLEEAGIMPSEAYYAQAPELRQVAFTLSRIANASAMARVKRSLERILAEGGTIQDFAEWVGETGPGWTSWYTELVYRNAVQGSYMRARWQQMNVPHIRRAFPILVYDAINDDRTSEICSDLDERWWWREDFPQSLYPPNHHACRSVVRMMTKERGEKLPNQTTGNPGVTPAEGWDGNPAENWQTMLERRESILDKFLEAS